MSTTHPIRQSVDSEMYSLQDDDPLSMASATLLNDSTTKERKVQQKKSMYKTSAINLFWILMW